MNLPPPPKYETHQITECLLPGELFFLIPATLVDELKYPTAPAIFISLVANDAMYFFSSVLNISVLFRQHFFQKFSYKFIIYDIVYMHIMYYSIYYILYIVFYIQAF